MKKAARSEDPAAYARNKNRGFRFALTERMRSDLIYKPYAAIPATAERQISSIGEIPPFFIFLEP